MGEEDSESSMIHNSAESSENSERDQTESDEDWWHHYVYGFKF